MTLVLVTLIQNAALLLAMMVVFDLVTSRKLVHGQWRRQALAGVILGGLCIGLMLVSFRLESGIIFDTRSVLLSLSGLFLGPVSTLFAMSMAAAYRFWLGGPGAWTGVLVILATGGIGILWRHVRQGRLTDISIRELYGFGVVVHLVMLALMLTLPWEAAQRVLGGIGLPVLLVYPLATVALGWLLAARFQRDKAAAALAMSEARYRSFFEAANVGKSVTLPTGEIEVNRTFCDMLGYAPEELRGKTWQELTPPEEIGPINKLLAPLMRGEKNAARFEKRYLHKNGSHVWADVSATMQCDGEGKPLHYIVTAMDITARKQLEIERQKFFLLAESSSEFIGMCDLAMNPLYVNPAGRRLVGLPDMAAACRVKVQDYYFPEDQRFIAEEFFPRVLREGHGDVEIRLRHFQTSEPIWMFHYLFSVHDASGTPVGWATISRGITGRRQAEESLKTYAARLQGLHRIDQAILAALDSPEKIAQEAVLHLRDLLHCQRVSVGLFDFEKQEARVFATTGVADSVVQTKLLFPEALYGDLDILRQNQLEIIEDCQQREDSPAIIKIIQAEGTRSSLNAPIASPRGLIGALSIGWETPRTITPDEQEIAREVAGQIAIAIEQARLLQETKRHAGELEQRVQERTAELLAANQELNTFAYAVSHDLRQPLRAMMGFSQALVEDHGATLPDAAHGHLDEIIQASRRMGALIDGLLRLSRSTRGELQRDVVDLSALGARLLGELAAAEPERHVMWTVAPGLTARGDERMIEVVLANLLDNAWKYTSKTSEPKIEVGALVSQTDAGMAEGPDSGAAPSPPAPVFFVRDNGAGFDLKHAARLFQPFQRLHREDEFPGIGIGLATVQRIVHRHGGTVRATAAPGQGATFSFSLSPSVGKFQEP